MRKEYFKNADYQDKSRRGGFISKIIEFVTNNSELVDAAKSAVTSGIDAVTSIKDAAKKPEDYRKSDKEIIEEMKTEKIYKELQELNKI